MRFLIKKLAGVLLLCGSSVVMGESNLTLFGQAHSVNYSEASALYQMLKNTWQDFPQADGRHAFSRTRLRSGAQERWLSIEYVQRYDYVLEFSPDTAELFYFLGAKRELPADRAFAAQLRLQQLDAYGARLGVHTPSWRGLSMSVYVNLLRGRALQNGEVAGTFLQQANGQYQVNAPIDYRYSQDLLLEHNKNGLDEASGQGGALDFAVRWQRTNFHAELRVEDAYLYMQWPDAGVLQGTVAFDLNSEAGRWGSKFKQGQRGSEEFIQDNLPRYVEFNTEYALPRWQLLAGGFYYNDLLFPRLGIARTWLNRPHRISAQYEFNSDKVVLSYDFQTLHSHPASRLSLQLGSDRWHVRQAHALELGLGLLLRW